MLRCSHLTSSGTLRVEECARIASTTLKASTVISAGQASSVPTTKNSTTQTSANHVTVTTTTQLVTVPKVQGSASASRPTSLLTVTSATRVTTTTLTASHVTASGEAPWEPCARWVEDSALVRRITLVLTVTSVPPTTLASPTVWSVTAAQLVHSTMPATQRPATVTVRASLEEGPVIAVSMATMISQPALVSIPVVLL